VGELLKRMTDIDIVGVPYMGAASAMNDLYVPSALSILIGGNMRRIMSFHDISYLHLL
jgi:hypothetical protein